ncbi:MAG TPA: Gmad2 immunoglobulin-like domain-containing protein [Dehalococcoidia bacterium]|nr:Gmad2 immunoglobulin-like domain-containing protein [Dehalococcoidia bacterium]
MGGRGSDAIVRRLLAFLALLLLTVLAIACRGGRTVPSLAPPTAAPTSLVTASPSPRPTPTPAPTATPVPNVCQPNPDPADPSIWSVQTPHPGQVVRSPLHVEGKGIYFEAGPALIALYDRTGRAIATTNVMVPIQEQGGRFVPSPYSVDLPFTVGANQPACLWVYEPSPRDGLPSHVVQVPILLQP